MSSLKGIPYLNSNIQPFDPEELGGLAVKSYNNQRSMLSGTHGRSQYISKWFSAPLRLRAPSLKTSVLDFLSRWKTFCRPKQNVAIMQSRVYALKRVLYLLAPLTFTFTILGLNWCNVYMTSRNANQTLALLQMVAKFHDILLTLSMSDIMLYYLQRQLLSDDGTVFGLFGPAYSVGVGSLPFLNSFWHPMYRSMWPGYVQWRTQSLVYLVLLTSVIGLAANPAASIVLLPRLDWWPAQDFFSILDYEGRMAPLAHGGFSMYIPKRLFPNVVDSSSLPSYNAFGRASPRYNRSEDPHVWATRSLPQYVRARPQKGAFFQSNESLDTDSTRHIIASGSSQMYRDYDTGVERSSYRTDTMITNKILAQYLSIPRSIGLPIYRLQPVDTAGGPWTLQAHVLNDFIKVPRANVWCEVQPAIVTQRNLSSIFGDNSTNNPFLHEMIDLRSIWSDNTLNSPSKVLFEWVEFSQIQRSVAGVILMPSNQSSNAEATICVVRAYWSFTSMWTLPNQYRGSIFSNFTYSPPLQYPDEEYQPGYRVLGEWLELC